MRYDVELVVVGGGIAGAALAAAAARRGRSVAVVEAQRDYRDLVRGEALAPWGMVEAERLGVSDVLRAAGSEPLRQWVQWDEVYEPDEAPTISITSLCQTFLPGIDSAFAIKHPTTCRALVDAARRAGAFVLMGARDVRVVPGQAPRVECVVDGEPVDLGGRLIVGAGGRNAPVGKQVGVVRHRRVHHWGSGLAVSGLDDWPVGVQAMGTEGSVMFFVFPQGDGVARLYLNYATADRLRYCGPGAAQRFLAEFDLKCLPYRELFATVEPIGPCVTLPSLTTWLDGDPVREGLVLIGDEAGANDPVLGTGLSNSLRDARAVVEILESTDDWSPASFHGYATERRERLRRLTFAADVLGTLSAEFGPDARERRRRAWERMRRNPNFALTQLVMAAGPDNAPDIAFDPRVVQKLLADERTPSRAGAGAAR